MSRRLILLATAIVAAAALLAPGVASAAIGPLSQFGSLGQGAGQISPNADVAFGPDGSAYVADGGNARVDVFGPDGKFAFAFGKGVNPGGGDSCDAASGCVQGVSDEAAGSLDAPWTLAVEQATGRVFVGEFSFNRISVFTAAGEFLYAFGRKVNATDESDVCTVASGCKRAPNLSDEGAIYNPNGLAFGTEGNLFVGDRVNNRIDVFTPAGAFVLAFGKRVESLGPHDICTPATNCSSGLATDAAGGVSPNDLAIAPDGRVFVSEGNQRVSVFTAGGEFQYAFGKAVSLGGGNPDVCTVSDGCKFGDMTSAAGSLRNASAIGISSAGDVFVAENVNNRVSRFTAAGAFVEAFGVGVVSGTNAFEICTAALGCTAGFAGSGPGAVSEPMALAVDCRGAIYTVEEGSGSARVQRFGEGGTPALPCPPEEAAKTVSVPPRGGTASVKPSNGFTLGKVKLNRKKGTATLTVIVPGPGSLTLRGKGVKKATKQAKAAGKVKLPVTPVGKTKKTLDESQKARVTVKVTFVPTGGDALSKDKPIGMKWDLATSKK